MTVISPNAATKDTKVQSRFLETFSSTKIAFKKICSPSLPPEEKEFKFKQPLPASSFSHYLPVSAQRQLSMKFHCCC